jgi:hypothetical protein
MAGLVPAIYVFLRCIAAQTWMPGTSPGMTSQCVDRIKKTLDSILKISLGNIPKI